MIPTQYFIEYDEAANKLKSSKKDIFQQLKSSKKLLEMAHEIVFKGYDAELKKIFDEGEKAGEYEMYATWNELLTINMESLRIAEIYYNGGINLLSAACSIIDSIESEDDAKKEEGKKIVARVTKKDGHFMKMLEGIECIAKGTIAPFGVMCTIVKDFNKKSILLKEELPILN